jgi:heme exporter protein CcmD
VTEYLAMGGYGAYVWTCFLLAGVVLAWNLVAALRSHGRARETALRRTKAGRPGP